ncbi:phosphotyrosine protein phosphatase [Mesonia aquimarina]|uniref:phosphotyrosine protein phosphatase n=1 Tax=Mesonia aquimarina TaxID=1504967 RepID=UPI000EF58E05|nr:phosphotyrosine protein phosphatase [Mesonia aquimarina]
MKHILFVCSANKDRSRTAEDFFSQCYPDFCFDSAGTNPKICRQLGTTYIQETQLALADRVFVMENKHRQALLKTFGTSYAHKITVLHIRDVYPYGAKALIEVLKEKVTL